MTTADPPAPAAPASREFVIVTGMSGAGRTQVVHTLEDLGWFVVENVPPALIPKVVELATEGTHPRVALGVTSRVDPEGLHSVVAQLRSDLRTSGGRLRLVFLNADTRVLVSRYDGTRRRHPRDTGGRSLEEVIEDERSLMAPVLAEADLVIDTSSTSVHDLSRVVGDRLGGDGLAPMQVQVMSFAFPRGIPSEADLVLDCRFLPNPHWVEGLRELTGLDAPVRTYLDAQPVTGAALERWLALLETVLPAYVAEGRAYLTVAFGCTGGRHRSVAAAEATARWLEGRGVPATIRHRELGT